MKKREKTLYLGAYTIPKTSVPYLDPDSSEFNKIFKEVINKIKGVADLE